MKMNPRHGLADRKAIFTLTYQSAEEGLIQEYKYIYTLHGRRGWFYLRRQGKQEKRDKMKKEALRRGGRLLKDGSHFPIHVHYCQPSPRRLRFKK